LNIAGDAPDKAVPATGSAPVAMTAMNSATTRKRQRKVPYRDAYRAGLAGLVLIALVALAFYHQNWSDLGAKKKPEPYAAGDAKEHPLRTGSLLIVPPRGQRCQHRTIDNKTWFIRDNGYVDCEEAMSKGTDQAGRDGNSSPRLDAIRDAFTRRK
jgi:hypothetical protein